MEQSHRDHIKNFEDILVEKTNFKKVYTLLLHWNIIPVGLVDFKDVSETRQRSDKENNKILYKIIKNRGQHAFQKLMQALQLSNPELANQVEGHPWNLSAEEWSCPPQVYSFSNADVRGSYRIVTYTGYREGWEEEVKNLKRTFQFLKYEGSEKTDPSAEELDELILNFTESKRDAGCYVFALSGHGHYSASGKESLLMQNNSYIEINEILPKICKAPSLLGKPKIIILQICRGDFQSWSYSSYAAPHSTAVEIHDLKDTIILRASRPGYVAYRDVELGGWFIKVLTDKIEQHARTKDVEEIMVEVSKEFHPKKNRTSSYSHFPEGRYMTACANAYSFKKFYFLPQGEASLPDDNQRSDVVNGNDQA